MPVKPAPLAAKRILRAVERNAKRFVKLLKMYLSDFYQYLDGGFNLKDVIQNGDMVYISLPNVTSKKSAEMLGQQAGVWM